MPKRNAGKCATKKRENLNQQNNTSNMRATRSEALELFHQFARFPPEIRCIIFNRAAREPRIIRIESSPVPGKYLTDRKFIHIDQASKVVPALFHTCHESRYAAQKVYDQQIFDARLPIPFLSPYIWFNPYSDIIHLNRDWNFDQFKDFFDRIDFPVFRVALDGWKYKSVAALSAIHHFTPPALQPPTSNSASTVPATTQPSGIRELFFFVHSTLWQSECAVSRNNRRLRPALHTGETEDASVGLERILEFYNLRRSNAGLTSLAKWSDGAAPLAISNVSYLPPARSESRGRKFEAMLINPTSWSLLEENPVSLKRVQFRTGCKLEVGCLLNGHGKGAELGFYGTRKEIEACKTMLDVKFGELASTAEGRDFVVDESDVEERGGSGYVDGAKKRKTGKKAKGGRGKKAGGA